jgi:hypothetical protein
LDSSNCQRWCKDAWHSLDYIGREAFVECSARRYCVLLVLFSFQKMVLRIPNIHLGSNFFENCVLEKLKHIVTLDFCNTEFGFIVNLENLLSNVGEVDDHLCAMN